VEGGWPNKGVKLTSARRLETARLQLTPGVRRRMWGGRDTQSSRQPVVVTRSSEWNLRSLASEHSRDSVDSGRGLFASAASSGDVGGARGRVHPPSPAITLGPAVGRNPRATGREACPGVDAPAFGASSGLIGLEAATSNKAMNLTAERVSRNRSAAGYRRCSTDTRVCMGEQRAIGTRTQQCVGRRSGP
jgi:hypothetical protein